MTDASEKTAFVTAELSRILNGSDFRVGAVVLTCAPLPGKGDVRIVTAIVMKDVSPDLAPDLAALPGRLRELATELEQTIAGQRPLPPQPNLRGAQ